MKREIRLTESQLHNIIRDTVQSILVEKVYNDRRQLSLDFGDDTNVMTSSENGDRLIQNLSALRNLLNAQIKALKTTTQNPETVKNLIKSEVLKRLK